MGEVQVNVNGRDYNIACDDGEEEHVRQLAVYLDARIGELLGDSRRRDGDSLILVMAGLLVADELSDAQGEIERLKSETAGNDKRTEDLASGVLALAERIETVAERLNGT